jgi:hypothetical protein
MSDTMSDDPFDPVSVEDKVEAYQTSPQAEPDEERPVVEPVEDPEAPLDSRADLVEDDDWDAATQERPETE